MTDQVIGLPDVHARGKHIRKLPAECARWLLDLSECPTTDESIAALEISDDEFGIVVMTPGSWRVLQRALHANRGDRWRALYSDQGAPQPEGGN